MDMHITSSLDSASPVSSSVDFSNPVSSSVDATKGLIRKNKGWNNLIPAKKGEKRNPSGKKKGTISIKHTVGQILTKDQAKAIATNIIEGAVAGEDSKQDRLLKLTGDLNAPQSVNPTTNNNTYTILIAPETIQSMRQFVKDRQSKYGDIDVIAIPISSSVS